MLKKGRIPLCGGFTALMLLLILIIPEIWGIFFIPLMCGVGLTLGMWIALRQLIKELEYLKTNCFD